MDVFNRELEVRLELGDDGRGAASRIVIDDDDVDGELVIDALGGDAGEAGGKHLRAHASAYADGNGHANPHQEFR